MQSFLPTVRKQGFDHAVEQAVEPLKVTQVVRCKRTVRSAHTKPVLPRPGALFTLPRSAPCHFVLHELAQVYSLGVAWALQFCGQNTGMDGDRWVPGSHPLVSVVFSHPPPLSHLPRSAIREHH